MSGRVRRVAIVGGELAAWIIALGLARALAKIDVAIEVVALPSERGADEAVAALPSLGALHSLIGLKDTALYRRCAAIPVLGEQFIDWDGAGGVFIHGFDAVRPAINDVDFVHFWSAARRNGLKVPYDAFSPAASAAAQGRVPGLEKQSANPRAPTPGYHLAAEAYAHLLREGCRRAGVSIVEAKTIDVRTSGGRIDAIRVDGERERAADLYVDATGSARLLASALAVAFEPWSQWFPGDRALNGSAAALLPPPAYSRFVATSGGWIGLLPLQDRVALVGRFAAGGDDELVASRLVAAAGLPVVDAPLVRTVATGRTSRSWSGNCVAVGTAEAVLDPLDGAEMQLLQIALSNLVTFWPADREAMPEADAYNRAAAAQIEAVRDFQLARYRLAGREEDFWSRARSSPAPETLAARLDLFGARGLLPSFGEEPFLPQNWAALLLGHGLVPAASDVLIRRTPEQEQMAKFQALLGSIADDVRAMPPMAAFLAQAVQGEGP